MVFVVARVARVYTWVRSVLRRALLTVAQTLYFVRNMLHGPRRHMNASGNVGLLERSNGAVGTTRGAPALALARDH